jgi:hypothetical protein
MLPFQADDAGYHRGRIFHITFRDPCNRWGELTFHDMKLWDVSKGKAPLHVEFAFADVDPEIEKLSVNWCDLLELVPVASEKKGFWK